MNKLRMNAFIEKDNNTKTQEEFIDRFFTKFKREYSLKEGQEEKYIELLKTLTSLDDKTYKTWYKELGKIDMPFINGNIDYVLEAVNNNSVTSLSQIYEINKKKNSLIKRSIPTVNITMVKENKEELIKEYNDMAENDELVEKIKVDFETSFDSKNLEEAARRYYEEEIEKVDKDTLNEIKFNLSKISAYAQRIEDFKEVSYIKSKNDKDIKSKHLRKGVIYPQYLSL